MDTCRSKYIFTNSVISNNDQKSVICSPWTRYITPHFLGNTNDPNCVIAICRIFFFSHEQYIFATRILTFIKLSAYYIDI